MQRGIRRVLRAAGPVDVLHLRMADVGSMAAARRPRSSRSPSSSPSPPTRTRIAAREAAGTLTRANFGAVDHAEHLVFRARLVRGLADAAHLVLFPRPELERDMRDLVGIDITAPPERPSVVAEGIDLTVIAERAVAPPRRMPDPPTSPTSTPCSAPCRRTGATCRSRSRSAGCTG